ncbi:MAG: thymidine phosphorylase family protein [Pseudomonadota bacterium]
MADIRNGGDNTDRNEPLKVCRVAIDTYLENVAYLNRRCDVYSAEGFQALNKVVLSNNGTSVFAVLNVVDDDTIVAVDEVGLSEQAFAQLGLEPGEPVTIAQAEPPRAMDAIRRKIAGDRLDEDDYRQIISDITGSRLSKMEIAAFLVSSGPGGLDRQEVLHLTRAMTESGSRLDWHEPVVVDKHCIGGLPGNRTTMAVVPIVAAHGMLMPKTSSRAITSPAGTADTMEVLANVELSPDAMHRVVRRERACLAWGGTARLAPADDIIISVERPLGIDSVGQMIASILSKKLAAGSTHLLVDIPVGPTAKVAHMREALQLRKLFEYIGDRVGLHLEVVVTDGAEPIGRGIGPVLEARDVMQVLANDPDAPDDLLQKVLRLAGRIIEFDPDVRGGQGYPIARDILESGRALAKMEAIIEGQGAPPTEYHPGPLIHEVVADRDGVVTAIDNKEIAHLAHLAGAPLDKGAGIDLFHKVGDPVHTGDPLFRIHAEFKADFHFAREYCRHHSAFTIGDTADINRLHMEL